MKRLTLWLCAALLTFAVGIACVFLWLLNDRSREPRANIPLTSIPAFSESEIPELPFCQLVARPGEHEDKVVRVRAVYSFGIHGATIGDRDCSSVDNITWVSLTPAIWDEVEQSMEKVYGKNETGPLKVLAVGKFGKNEPVGSSDSWKDRAPYRFDLMRFEKVYPSN